MLRLAVLLAAFGLALLAHAQTDRYEALANSAMTENRPTPETAKLLWEELLFQRATQTYIYLGPNAPDGKHGNWLATVPGKGYFAILRLYSPTEAAINKSWKPGDIEKVN
jgi:hypothetical protein